MRKLKLKNIPFQVLILLVAFLLQSCLSFTPIRFEEVSNVSIDESNKEYIDVKVEARIKNPNNYNIVLKKGTLQAKSRLFGSAGVKMNNKIKLRKNSTDKYALTLRVDTKNKLTLGQGLLALGLGKKMGLKFDGKVRARAFIFGKTFKVENVSGDDFLKLVQ